MDLVSLIVGQLFTTYDDSTTNEDHSRITAPITSPQNHSDRSYGQTDWIELNNGLDKSWQCLCWNEGVR